MATRELVDNIMGDALAMRLVLEKERGLNIAEQTDAWLINFILDTYEDVVAALRESGAPEAYGTAKTALDADAASGAIVDKVIISLKRLLHDRVPVAKDLTQ